MAPIRITSLSDSALVQGGPLKLAHLLLHSYVAEGGTDFSGLPSKSLRVSPFDWKFLKVSSIAVYVKIPTYKYVGPTLPSHITAMTIKAFYLINKSWHGELSIPYFHPLFIVVCENLTKHL